MAYFLTDEDREKVRLALAELGINPGSTRTFPEYQPGTHRASDAVVFKVTSNISKRTSGSPSSAICEAWTIAGWASAGYSETVYNISDSVDIVASSGSPLYLPALIDRDGTWFFCNFAGSAIQNLRVNGLDLQYTKDPPSVSTPTWVTWHTGEACA